MRNKDRPIKFNAAYYPTAKFLGVEIFGAVFGAVIDYATKGGARVAFEIKGVGKTSKWVTAKVEGANSLYNLMCDDIDADRRQFDTIAAAAFGGGVDGVIYSGGMIRGARGWVKITPAEYYELRDLIGGVVEGATAAEVITHYIRYIDCAAEKSGNKNGWGNWAEVIRAAIEGDWDGWIEETEMTQYAEGRAIINAMEGATDTEKNAVLEKLVLERKGGGGEV